MKSGAREMKFGKVLLTTVYNNLRYEINTDSLCDCKLWIEVYDGEGMLASQFMWLLDKNHDIVKSHWKNASRFDWSIIKLSIFKPYFPQILQKRLDSYFTMKAFW